MTQVHPAPPMQPPMGVPMVPGAPTVAAPGVIPQIHDLLNLQKLYVQQKVDFLEMFTGFEVSNTYNVFLTPEHRSSGTRWLLAKEESSCFQRQCLKPIRAFKMDVGLARAAQAQTIEQQLGLVESAHVFPMVRIDRPCFCCLSSGTVADGKNAPIGTFREPCRNLFYCCPLQFLVTKPGAEPEAEPAYTLEGPSACYISLCSKIPCRDPMTFPMTEVSTGRVVGSVNNVPNGCCKMCFTTADDYEVEFAAGSTATERGMLLAMTFVIDFRFFEAKDDKNKHSISM